MAISLRTIERGQPGVAGGGEKKFYATPVTNGEANIDELSELIELVSTVSGIDVLGVLKSFITVVPRELAKGKIVRLGDLGSFRVSISSEGHENAEDVSGRSVTNSRIIFRPGKELKKMLNNLEFVKTNGAES